MIFWTLLMMFQAAQAPVAALPPSPAVVSAQQWVGLVDQGGYAESWDQAGALMKTHMGRDAWAAALEPARKPLGAVASRKLRSETPTKTLPGAPDGDYDVVQFDADFAGNRHMTETVFLAHEASGWKVDGYYIK
ncbi:MAG TPA: DUF4019 domain-containing protein [Allosphingosinicella sp.]|nr:DUF4019 domain-containing protein [Allosphingosinicella sp.]